MRGSDDRGVSQPAIETSGLSKSYGAIVGIADLDLSVRAGEVFGFLGPNGAGKTTTIRLLLGLMKPSGGDIHLLGRELHSHLPRLLAQVGYLPGDFGLYRDQSGHETLLHLLKLRAGRRARTRTLERLEARFEIDFARSIRTYSKGMKQVVGIVQAFAHDPRLLILDEPTSGLDPLKQEQFYQLLREERERGKTIFFSSHLLREVERTCDRVAIIDEGHLLAVQDIGEYRARLGKRVRVRAGDGAENLCAKIRALSGARDVRLRDGGIEFHYSGPVQRLLQALAALDLEDFQCEDPDIEDFFFHSHRDPRTSR
jgi:ABC-2 type transport system ATP-binding protein